MPKQNNETDLEITTYMQTDLLLINVPRISLVYPPAGTSLLKGVVEQQGFTCNVKDANYELLNSINDDDDYEL